MSDRAARLASRIDEQNKELLRFLLSRTEPDLQLPCADPSGSTVDSVLGHLSEGYDLVLGWLEGVAKGETAAVSGPDGHAHVHEPGDLRTYTERLRSGGQAWEVLTRGLSDAQLDLVPPPAQDITDGTQPLARIIDRMIEHQSIHLDYVRDAVPGLAGTSERTA